MSRARNLVSNVGIFGIATLGSQIISFALVPLYTHTLQPEEFGTIELVTTGAALAVPIVSLTIFESLVRFLMSKGSDPRSITSNTAAITLIMAASFLLTYPLVALIIGSGSTLPYLYAMVVVQVHHSLASQYARGSGRIKLFAITGVFQSLLFGASNVLLVVYLGLGVEGFLASTILSAATAAVFLFVSSGMYRNIRMSYINKSVAKELLSYSIPLVPNYAMWWFVNSANRYFVYIFAGAGTAGVFAISNKVPLLLLAATSVFAQAWQLSAFDAHGDVDRDAFYSRTLQTYSSILFLGCAGVLVITKPLFDSVFASSYSDGWKYVAPLLLAAAFSSLSLFVGTAYSAAKKTAGALKTSIAAAILAVSLNVMLVPGLGAYGAALASFISFFFLFCYRVIDTRRYLNVSVNWPIWSCSLALILLQYIVMHLNFSELWEFIALACATLVLLVANLKTLVKLLRGMKRSPVRPN